MKFKHFILTRYALRATELRVKLTPDWFPHRLELFRNITLPSVNRQTVDGFVWLIYFSPEYMKDMGEAVHVMTRCPFACPVVIDKGCFEEFNDEMRASMDKWLTDETHVISTRLDNDDEIAPDFLELVQAQFKGQDKTFVNFTNGRNKTKDGFVLHPHPSNMFVSLIEKREGFEGIFTWAHNMVDKVGPVIQLPQEDRWTHHIHGRNVWL